MPRHDSLSTTPGQFDYPPASVLPESSISLTEHLNPSGEDLQRRRNRARRQYTAQPQPTWRPYSPTELLPPLGPPWATFAVRQSSRLRPERSTPNISTPPLSGTTTARSMNYPTTRAHRLLRTRDPNFSQTREEGRRLAQIDEDIRNIVERPVAISRHGLMDDADETGSTREEGETRRKRRKLDNTPQKDYVRFEYGYFGQIVPGKLKMELVRADGGSCRDGPLNLFNSREAENVLRDDKSVFRTKSSHCNIVFRHQGETTFSLERIVIKAPKSGFTDPVQDGLIFVSMKDDAIFERTTRYQIVHFPTCHFASHFISRQNASEDSAESVARGTGGIQNDMFGPDSRYYDSLTSGFEENHPECDDSPWDEAHEEAEGESESSGSASESEGEVSNSDRNSDRLTVAEWSRTPPMPRSVSTILSQTADFDFNIPDIALNWARSEQQSELRSREQHRRRQSDTNRTTETYLDRYAVLGEGQIAQPALLPGDEWTYLPYDINQRNHTRAAEHQTGRDTGTRNHTELLAPAARFSMHREKNKMSIKFETPISAKYILLKMWAPRDGKTIDVQSIVCYGFAGPRYWPAVEMR